MLKKLWDGWEWKASLILTKIIISEKNEEYWGEAGEGGGGRGKRRMMQEKERWGGGWGRNSTRQVMERKGEGRAAYMMRRGGGRRKNGRWYAGIMLIICISMRWKDQASLHLTVVGKRVERARRQNVEGEKERKKVIGGGDRDVER